MSFTNSPVYRPTRNDLPIVMAAHPARFALTSDIGTPVAEDLAFGRFGIRDGATGETLALGRISRRHALRDLAEARTAQSGGLRTPREVADFADLIGAEIY